MGMAITRCGAMLALLLGALSAGAQAPSASRSASARVSYLDAVPVAQLRKLLGGGGQRLYVADKNGVVQVVDGRGQPLLSLQAKNAKGEALLRQPEAVAVGPDRLYVVDSELHSVAMYALDGVYLGRFASKGSDAGELSEPQGLAYFEGLLYVADTGNRRIQMFGDNGVFLGTLAIDSASINRLFEQNKVDYKLDKPVAVAVDPQGQIHVLDAAGGLFSDKSAIKVYAQDGSYIKQMNHTGKPAAMFMAADGLYVADRQSHAVKRFDAAGNLITSFGSKGEGRGQFMSLSGLAIEAGHVFLGDAERSSIHHFQTAVPAQAPAGAPRTTAIPFVRWLHSMPAAVGKMVWDGKDTLYAVARDKPLILKFREGEVQELAIPELTPNSLAFDKAGALWVLDKEHARVSKRDAAAQEVFGFGGQGSRHAQFDGPTDLVIADDGHVYVSDTGNSRVQIFSSDGVFLRAIDKSKSDSLSRPTALALDAQGRLYVLDSGRSRVAVFSAEGDALWEFGQGGDNAAVRLNRPLSLMVNHDEVFVLDADRIQVYTLHGEVLRSFGAPGSAAGALMQAEHLAARNATDFFVAERGLPRIQRFRTHYKPRAPKPPVLQPAVHGIELSWPPAPEPYVAQYHIYRSSQPDQGFVEVATSRVPSFVDQDLAPEQTYFYRLAAATPAGDVGLPGEVAGASALKYVPPALSEIKTETTTSRIQIAWKALDPKWVKAYRVYRQEGDKFIQEAETAQAQYVRDQLEPGTAYTVHLTALGVDGIESDKVEVQRSTQVDNRPPLDIDAGDLHNVFSNSYKRYEEDGVGKVRLTNNTRNTLLDIKVSFVLNNFMDFPTETRIESLAPGETREVMLKAVFNNNILTLTEDSPVQAKIEASYFESGQPRVYSKIRTINIYDKHRLSWDERNRFAAFVTPKDPVVINFSRSVAAEFGSHKEPTQLAAALFNTLGALGMTYVQDPTNPYQVTSNKTDYVDYIQYPRETIQRKSGDCDDLVALYAASLESLGIATRALLVPGHMLMMLATGVEAGTDGYTMSDMYVAYEGMLWIPVEVTLVGQSFIKAWETGAATYYRDKGKAGFDLFDIRQAWRQFKPATLPDDRWQPLPVGREDIERIFPGDLRSVLKISSQTMTRHYLKAIEDNPQDLDAHLQVGIILARQGDRPEARKYFEKIIAAAPGHAAALNNLGNVHMLEGQFKQAQKLYEEAARQDASDPEILVNLAQAYKATDQIGPAKDAFVRAQRIDPKMTQKYKAMGLELLHAISTPEPAPKPADPPKRGKSRKSAKP